METKKNIDTWASLHALLDIDQPSEKKIAEPTADSEKIVTEVSAAFIENPPFYVEEPKNREEEKKSRFDRFPKINLWDAPQEDPLDAVIGGKKTATPTCETFTSKKLERVETTSGRTARQETEPVPPTIPTGKPISKGLDPWSMIATQVGCVAAAAEVVAEEVVENRVVPPSVSELPREQEWELEVGTPKLGRRSRPSMFDDVSVEESQESTAVRNMFDAEEPKTLADPVELLSSILDDRPVQRVRDPKRREHVRGRRGGDFTESGEIGRETGDDDFRAKERGSRDRSFGDFSVQERGRRVLGSTDSERVGLVGRDRDMASSRLSDSDSGTWDADLESPPVERSVRRRSRRMDSSVFPMDRGECSSSSQHIGEGCRKDVSFGDDEQSHRSIPSWSDAISVVIAGNVARRASRSPEQRRGKRS